MRLASAVTHQEDAVSESSYGSPAVLEKVPTEHRASYLTSVQALANHPRGFEIFENPKFETGDHPDDYVDRECAFAAEWLQRLKPESLLDVGSYRWFILGLLASYRLTTIDIRARAPATSNESVLTCDAKDLPVKDGSFDAILTMCAIEHFGLGRYGDAFDADGDLKGVREMLRVLKPGGHLIFTTTITNAPAHITFNRHRVYSHAMICDFMAGMTCVGEQVFERKSQAIGPVAIATATPRKWSVYMGCWQKPLR